MKKIILLVCGFLMFSLLSCTEEYKHKKKSEMLLKQAKETELEALYDKMVEYLDKDENFQFVKEKNRYFIKDEALNYVMRSLYNFHKENHLPILQDKEHPENWDDWFYFYKFIVNFGGNESLDKLDQYNKLTTACDYCRLAYQNETDITWPTINPDTINDFSTIKDAALNTITRLNEAKQKADAQEAERQRQEAEKKQRAEAEKKRQEEERRKIEASTFKGVWNFKFGMSYKEVKAKESSWDEEFYDNHGFCKDYNGKKTYGGLGCRSVEYRFTKYGELYEISIYFTEHSEDDLKALVHALCEKYGFKETSSERYKSNYGVKMALYIRGPDGPYRGYHDELEFTNLNIYNAAEKRAQKEEKDAFEAKKSKIKSRTDF